MGVGGVNLWGLSPVDRPARLFSHHHCREQKLMSSRRTSEELKNHPWNVPQRQGEQERPQAGIIASGCSRMVEWARGGDIRYAGFTHSGEDGDGIFALGVRGFDRAKYLCGNLIEYEISSFENGNSLKRETRFIYICEYFMCNIREVL